MIKHQWKEENIGHSTYGPVCQVCRVDFLRGMSELGCPKRLWDYHYLPGRYESEGRIAFKEPTEVIEDYQYEKRPPRELTGDKLKDLIGEMSPHPRRLLRIVFTFVRNDEIIKIMDFPGDSDDEWEEKKTGYVRGLRVVCLGSNIEQLKSKIKNGESGTPFLDYLESNTPNFNDSLDYQWTDYYRRPEPEVKLTI